MGIVLVKKSPDKKQIWVISLATVAGLMASAIACPGIGSAETIDAQRLEERLPDKKHPADEAAGATKPPRVQVDQDDLASIPEFVLRTARIDGVTAVEPKQAEACAAGFVGKTIGAADLVQLTDCITGLYRSQGYFLSRAIVPKQQVEDGVLFVKAVEGYVADIVPDGMSEADARSQFGETLAERPTRLETFERDLLLLADRNGYRVASSQLLPDPIDLARFTFKVKVTTSSVVGRIFGDNRGTGSNGTDQVFGSVVWNSVVTSGDRVGVSLFTLPSSSGELFYADIAYAAPWLDGALWTEFGGSRSETHQLDAFASDTTDGESERFYFRATAPLLRTRAQSLWASVLFDSREASQSTSIAKMSDERLRLLRGSFSYTIVDGATRADFTIEGSRGLDAFGASRNADPLLTRPDARPQFTKVRMDAALTQKLDERWDATLSFAGQHADGALVSVEEFGVGGARYGRAYNYSELTGDDGAAISLELRYSLANVADWMKSLQFYVFADAAMVWNRGGDSSTSPKSDLSSAGLGIRISPVPGVTAGIELAQPLSRDVAEKGDRNLRPFFTLQMGW